MTWEAYREWHSYDRGNRPAVSLADGYLAGAAVSLQGKPDHMGIDEIVGSHMVEGPRQEMVDYLAQTRSGLDAGDNTYTPTLEVTEDGEIDLAGWASGFIKAIECDLEMWLYHLAGQPALGFLVF